MQVTEPEDAQRHAQLYQATIAHAARGAPDLMARLVAHTRSALRDLESRAQDRREAERLTASRRLLNQCEADAVARFAEELEAAFGRMAALEQPVAVRAGQPHFDQIAGMDKSQVEQSVENARVRHAVQIAADATLVELNGLICSLLGLEQVQLERNPLRPAVYVDAVAAALAQLSVPPAVRQGWLSLMSGALGQELDVYYRQLCADLRAQGVGAIRPAAARTAAAAQPGHAPDAGAALTFERLRALLARTPAQRALDDRSDQYHPASEPAPLDASDTVTDTSPGAFQATVPAAFEAARDMKQLAQVARRLEAGAAGGSDAGSDHPLRRQLRQDAHGLDQALALEVVALMVDNIRHDPRLLGPVQDLVARLEPALLKLALVDPQFFSHKQHPARRLLHEITYRSIAFESPDSRGFSGFMEPLHAAVVPLADGAVNDATPFDQVLHRLLAAWGGTGDPQRRQIATAVQALQQAEQRAALAATIVREVLQRPDAVQVPSRALDFLCGPWAQVVAHARMTDRTGADDPGQYAATIDSLMWSLQPALTSQDLPALRRLLPGLRERLRQGLADIAYPQEQVDAYLQLFDRLHQRALDARAFADTEVVLQATLEADSMARWSDADSAWLAPAEAQASGFIDMPVESVADPAIRADHGLVVGAWVALMVEGSWTRTRLAWTSANGSLLLFADALGTIHSLSRRACEQLLANGHLRTISSDPVEDALDAVAQTALRNSVDVKF